MNERVEKLLADVEAGTLTMVAREVIDDDSATLVGDVAFADIDTPHNTAANHLGHFNGDLAVNPVELPFEIARDAFAVRWLPSEIESTAQGLIAAKDSPLTKQAYPDTPVEAGVEIANLARQIFDLAKSLPHSISFGDSHSRNMFPLGSQTVGIDWASVSNKPLSADIGVLIGSSLSFEVAEAAMIIKNEKLIYESYVEGIQSSGWNGNLGDL